MSRRVPSAPREHSLSSPLCEHKRVRTTCTVCRSGAPERDPGLVYVRSGGPERTETRRRGPDGILDTFLDALDRYVERERAASQARFKENLAAALDDRVAAGRAITDVTVAAVSHENEAAEWALLRCPANWSKFRVGSSLLLHRGDVSKAIPCRLLTDGELEFRIGAEFRQRMKGIEVGPGWTLDEGWSDYSENLRRAIDELREHPRRHWVHGILSGAQSPVMDPARQAKARRGAGGLGLDPDQEDAFVRSAATQSYYLIQGPPGSGKTAVLSQLAAYLAAEGQKVLVTAVTHRAINHALRKTQAVALGTDVVKVGGAERSEHEVTTFTSYMDWRQQYRGGGVVVGATCHTRLEPGFFDTVIFDEASQFPIPLAIRGMLYGKRYVFIGDDQQMDPVVVAEHPEPWVALSVFSLLREHAPGTMLRTTYRLNAELNEFPSRAFYGGQLRPSRLAESRRIRYARPPEIGDVLDANTPSVLVEVPHAGATVRSPEEARLAARLALAAHRAGVPGEEIGIITPFRAQERLIRSELARQSGRLGVPRNLVVETVERVQGQERDLAIISLTVSDLKYAAEAAEFFFRPSRFNVALTRARSKRVLLMDPGLLRLRPSREFSDWVENLRAFHAMTPRIVWSGNGRLDAKV